MRIEYQLAPDDWAAFGEYCARNSPQFRRSIQTAQLVGIAVCVCAAAVFGERGNANAWALICVIAAAVWFWYWPRRVMSHVRQRERPCLRGRHMMEVVPEGLHAECDITNSTVRWDGVQSIGQTATHVFVMLNDLQGYVVPKAGVETGNVDAFVEEVSAHLRRAA